MAVADGCNWGDKPREAAILACNEIISYLSCRIDSCKDTSDISFTLLKAFMHAHNKIISTKEGIHDPGTTTVLAGVLIKLDNPIGIPPSYSFLPLSPFSLFLLPPFSFLLPPPSSFLLSPSSSLFIFLFPPFSFLLPPYIFISSSFLLPPPSSFLLPPPSLYFYFLLSPITPFPLLPLSRLATPPFLPRFSALCYFALSPLFPFPLLCLFTSTTLILPLSISHPFYFAFPFLLSRFPSLDPFPFLPVRSSFLFSLSLSYPPLHPFPYGAVQ